MSECKIFGFIGLGLIGGSIAKAIRSCYPNSFLIACDPDKNALALALQEGIINRGCHEIGAHFSDCDFLFLCAPVSHNDENLLKVKQYLSPHCLLTDVGSVKTEIHKQVEAAGLSHCFIGGHPMAGSERTGYQNSKALLLENAYYILTPAKDTKEGLLTSYQNLVSSLGAIPLVLDYKQHDYVTAAVSHLPHVAASSLVKLIKDSDSPDGIMKLIAAGGFKDITRIASSSPAMWQQICLTNKDNILLVLDNYIRSLTEIRMQIQEKDSGSLYDFFNTARNYRESFIDASSGPIKKSFSLSIEIADETGALASIATLLALNNISIKNIGIVHNREQEEGVLIIEFYAKESIEKAKQLLSTKGYTIFL